LALLVLSLMLAGCGKHAAESDSGDEKEGAGPTQPVEVEIADATVRPMEVTVVGQGTLTAAQGASVKVAPVAPGRLTTVLVREGDHVSAGQVVATLDSRVQEAQARSAAAALTAAEAQVRQSRIAATAAAEDQSSAVKLARLALRSAEIDRDTSVRNARTALSAAETDLRKVQAGARPQEIATASSAVAQARATRDRTATELERQQFLFDKGISARRQLEDARTALAVANAALDTASQQESLVRAGARPEDVRATQIKVGQARDALSQAEASGAAKVAQARTALRQAEQAALQVEVKRQEAAASRDAAAQKAADLAAARTTASTSELRAPIAGVVTRRALNPGDMADPASAVLDIANSRALNLVANLPADEGAAVRPAMRVRVTTDSGTAYGGQVVSVGQVEPQTNLLSVRIVVANPAGALKAGEFATAQIVVREDPLAVVVPKQAVVTQDGKQVVFTVADGVAHRKEVETGPEEGDYVEVTRGISAGQKVIRIGQYELADGAKVKPTEEKGTKGGGEEGKKGAAPVGAGKEGGQ